MFLKAVKPHFALLAVAVSGVTLLCFFPEFAHHKAVAAFVAVNALMAVIDVSFFSLFAACRRIGSHEAPSLQFIVLRAFVALFLILLTFAFDTVTGRVILLSGVCTGQLIFMIAVIINRKHREMT